MAISASFVFEVRTTGSDTANSGGYKTGSSGTDFSQQDAAQYTLTGVTSVGSGNVILTASAAAVMVGNTLIPTAGTNFTLNTVFEITAVSVGVSITVSTNNAGTAICTGAGAAGTVVIGGAFVSPGMAGASHVANNKCHIKSGTYSITSASANVAGGCVSWTASSGGNEGLISGYGTSRGDYGTMPLLQASGINTFTIIAPGTKVRVENIAVDGISATASKGIVTASNVVGIAYKCKALNCKGGGIAVMQATACEATGCATVAAIGAPQAMLCWAHDNTITGFANSGTFSALVNWSFCYSTNNTGASSDGFAPNLSTSINQVLCCTAYANGRDGYRAAAGSTQQIQFMNCLGVSNTGFNFNDTPTPADGVYLFNCAGYNTGSGNVNGVPAGNQISFVTLTGVPFTNVGSNDYSLNNVAGQGQSCLAVGMPGIGPGGTSTGYLDIGAFQHRDISTYVGSNVTIHETRWS